MGAGRMQPQHQICTLTLILIILSKTTTKRGQKVENGQIYDNFRFYQIYSGKKAKTFTHHHKCFLTRPILKQSALFFFYIVSYYCILVNYPIIVMQLYLFS